MDEEVALDKRGRIREGYRMSTDFSFLYQLRDE
jgi:hypothetical protein